jgi:ABC-type sugar transport system permease subunit
MATESGGLTARLADRFDLSERDRRSVVAWLALVPTLSILILYRLLPLLWNFLLSFQDMSYTGSTTFVGLENYRRLLTDPVFVESLVNTLVLLGTIPVGITIALGLALLLNQKFPGSDAFRSIFFLPYIVMMVAVAVIWTFMFKSDNGVINYLLIQAGLIEEGIRWTSSGSWALVSVFIVHVWKTVGFYMVILLAGLQTIPTQLYEVAYIDGASRVQRFRHITLPLLTQSLGVCVLVGMIVSFRLFDLVFVLTDGGPAHSTEILLTWLYKQAFRFGNFGYAAVLTIVLFVMMVSIIGTGRLLQRRATR